MAVIVKPGVGGGVGSVSSLAMKRSERDAKSASSREELQAIFAAQREALREYINDHCIARAPSGSQELPSIDGKGHYNWQFYLRSALLIGSHLDFVARCFWAVNYQRFSEAPFQIAGVEAAAAPIIAAIVLRGHYNGIALNAFTIRKERKNYGLCNLIEGAPASLPVMLVDDLTSTEHKTIWHAVRAIRAGGVPLYPTCFVVVFKGRREGSPRVLNTSLGRVTIESIFTLEDFALA